MSDMYEGNLQRILVMPWNLHFLFPSGSCISLEYLEFLDMLG